MWKVICVVVVLLVSFEQYGSCYSGLKKTNFDFLMLSQSWPITGCITWKEKKTNNYCTLPENSNLFILHGLWPSDIGSTSKPSYCDDSDSFNSDVLSPILDDLKARWTNIEGGTSTYSFWSHEWTKHGTCAKVLPEFNSELKYFTKTLSLNKKYDIYQALSDYGIVPGTQSYSMTDFVNAIVNKFGKIPQIECTTDKSGEALLSEIRLCFDNSLNLIDCSSVKVNPKDCKGNKSAKYLKTVPYN